jgi:hypothetical protein
VIQGLEAAKQGMNPLAVGATRMHRMPRKCAGTTSQRLRQHALAASDEPAEPSTGSMHSEVRNAGSSTCSEPIFVDVPDANPGTKAFLAELDVTPMFETARMYTGRNPASELSKLFGVTTFELG